MAPFEALSLWTLLLHAAQTPENAPFLHFFQKSYINVTYINVTFIIFAADNQYLSRK